MKIEGEFLDGEFISRPNRFLGIVSVKGKHVQCFIPNPGRMFELLVPKIHVFLRRALNPNRKTAFDLVGVEYRSVLVSIDSNIPNKLLYHSIIRKKIPELQYSLVKPEISFGNSRIDFFLQENSEKCLMEVKSCTLVEDGWARFPDAPTKRGSRHVRELIDAKKKGFRAVIFFCIQRNDAIKFSPNDETDPEFGRTLRKAARSGVEILAFTCNYSITEIELDKRIKIEL
ncbi:MAG: DNA/RNA nuclease SfsA [Candidatus Helarchaeota archaeon]